MNKTVSIIGVGNMGAGMALNLLSRGYQVYVRDLDAAKESFLEEKGALRLYHPAQSAIYSITTIVAVVDAQQTQDVLFGPQGLLQASQQELRNHTVILCPTIAPQEVEQLASRLAEQGVATIDAPMSGGPARARDGSMSLMVACDEAVFAQHQILLRDLSSKLFQISTRPGDGARTKLVNNLLAAINLTGAAEAIAMAQRLGLDPSRTLDVIEQSSGQSWIGSERMRRALAGQTHPPAAHMSLLAKDTRLAMQAAHDAGCANPLGEVATGLFAKALASGMRDLDDAHMLDLLQRP